MQRKDDGRPYVRKVHEEQRRFLEDLFDQAHSLKRLVSALEGERDRLAAELRDVRAELERREAEQSRLHSHLAAVETESQRLLDNYGSVERQSSNLANLYVASYRLHGTLDRQEVLAAIQEIVATLIGCEEMVVLELDRDGKLSVVASFGVEAARFAGLRSGSGLIGRAVAERATYVAGRASRETRGEETQDLTACIPLLLDGRPMGAIALFKLLAHKQGLEDGDYELFDLLATHAATALYCAALHAKSAAA